jgi:hypothetical protein
MNKETLDYSDVEISKKELIEIHELRADRGIICQIWREQSQGWHIFNINDFDYPENYEFKEMMQAYGPQDFYTFDPEIKCSQGDDEFNFLIESFEREEDWRK